MTLEHLKRMVEHDRWANRRMIQALRSVNVNSPQRLAHLINAEYGWLGRVSGEDLGSPRLPDDASIDDCAAALDALDRTWASVLDGLDELGLEREIEYERDNTVHHNTIRDILTHVVMHSHYHRGQIAHAVRRSGGDPPVIDFIAWRRKQQTSA